MLARNMEKVVIVGAGLTGAVTSSILRQKIGDKTQIQVWDKSRGTGGRMSTSKDPNNPACTVDLGAQYISATPDYFTKHSIYYEDLLGNGILKNLDCDIVNIREKSPGLKHFVTPSGIGSIVKHYLKKSGASTTFGERISRVDLNGNKWTLTTDSGKTEQTNGLILTMPVPQLFQLAGDITDIIESQTDIKKKLSSVEYSSRFALGLFYKPGTQLNIPWGAKYFKEDDCIVYVAIDNTKRGQDNSTGCSVAVHTNVPFGLMHLEEDMKSVCDNYIMPRLRQLVPELPEPDGVKPHKWRYSQVYKGYSGSPGSILLHNDPPLILAGDAFTHSNFDGCIESAEAAVNHMAKL